MKLSRRTNTIILWVISIALMVGMIVMFTPTMGNLGGGQRDTSTPALFVNGEPINELEIARAQQGQLYSTVREGQAAEDLQLLMLDQLIQQEVLVQAASRVNVSGGEVRDAVNEFREQNGVAGRNNDEAYLSLIGRVGFTDASFRDYLREQLRLEKYQSQLTEDLTVNDQEVEAFYALNQDDYRSDERILARMIVVDDRALAADLRAQAVDGADFAELAAENSIERADRAGALGAAADSTDPQPVGRAALPTPVAAAAFGLRGPGLTDVIESGSRAYVVQVEEYLPAQVRPLDDVRAQVEEDALAAKQGRVLEDRIAELRAEATVTAAEGSEYSFDNDVVARVGDSEIMETDLVRATYTNPQIQQALGPETADLIVQFFKPTVLSQLIDREVAYLGAQDLDANFVGPKALVAQEALAWVSRDVEASDEELQTFYESNLARFTVPAEADVTRVEFAELATAEAFRSALLAGADVQDAAGEFEGDLEDVGTVFEGDLEQALDVALFGTDAFEPLPDSERGVSDVLVVEEPAPVTEEAEDAPATEDAGEADESAPADAEDAAAPDGEPSATGDTPATDDAAEDPVGDGAVTPDPAESTEPAMVERFVVLIAERTPERVRPLEEVRAQVEREVLARKRSEVQADWLAELKQEITVVNLLEQAESDSGEPAATEGVSGIEDAADLGVPVDGTADTDTSVDDPSTNDDRTTEESGAADPDAGSSDSASDDATDATDGAGTDADDADTDDSEAP